MRSRRPTPAAPLSLFTPPHSWQCPAQRWTGARRARAEGERGRAPAGGPAWRLLKAERQSENPAARAKGEVGGDKIRWAELGHPGSGAVEREGRDRAIAGKSAGGKAVGGARGSGVGALLGSLASRG